MTPDPPTLSRWATVRQALRFANLCALDQLLVLDSGNLVGVICQCRLWSAPPEDLLATHMTPHVISVGPKVAIEEAIHVMHGFEIGCLPVLDRRRLIGLVTRQDLLCGGIPPAETGPICSLCGTYRHVRWSASGVPLCLSCAPAAARRR